MNPTRNASAPPTGNTAGRDVAARLAREHALAHLDADLRWLDAAAELVEEP